MKKLIPSVIAIAAMLLVIFLSTQFSEFFASAANRLKNPEDKMLCGLLTGILWMLCVMLCGLIAIYTRPLRRFIVDVVTFYMEKE